MGLNIDSSKTKKKIHFMKNFNYFRRKMHSKALQLLSLSCRISNIIGHLCMKSCLVLATLNTCHYCLIKCSNNSIDGDGNFHYQLSSISHSNEYSTKFDAFNHFSELFAWKKGNEIWNVFLSRVCFERKIKRFAIRDCLACLLFHCLLSVK